MPIISIKIKQTFLSFLIVPRESIPIVLVFDFVPLLLEEHLAKYGVCPKLGREHKVPRLGGSIPARKHILDVPTQYAIDNTVQNHDYYGPAKVHGIIWNWTCPDVRQL
jgi:hypothetical protein